MATSSIELSKRVRSRVDWLIPGLLKRGNTAFMIGQPKKACKSWMILDACWALSEGKPVWNIYRADGSAVFAPEQVKKEDGSTEPRVMRCVYFTQEDTEDDIQDRIEAHTGTGRKPNDRLWIVPKNLKMVFDEPSGRELIQKELDAVVKEAGPIDLVCFDPMRRMHRGDENDSAVIGKMWEVLDRIHKMYNCATFISHHTRKPPQDKSGYDPTDPYTARGSGDIYGGGDAFMTIVPGKAGPKGAEKEWRIVSMHFESKRGKQLPPARLKIHFGTGQVEWLGAEFEPGETEEEQGEEKKTPSFKL